MSLASPPFFSSVEQVAHQVLVECMPATEFGNRHTYSVELFSSLIRCEGGGHSVHLCSNVFMYW